MTSEQLYEVIGDIDEKYVKKAKEEKKKVNHYKVWGTIAACVCLAVGGVTLLNNVIGNHPSENVQIPNPLSEMQSLEDMEKELGFQVPVLDKDVDIYIVINGEDSKSARIEYADGSTFNMAQGTGDISGIYGGTFKETQEINHAKVSFYEYESEENVIQYALWEKDGFTYSYAGEKISVEEIQSLIQ